MFCRPRIWSISTVCSDVPPYTHNKQIQSGVLQLNISEMAIESTNEVVNVLSSMFPEALSSDDGSLTLKLGDVTISIHPLAEGGVSLAATSPTWSRKTTQSHKEELDSIYSANDDPLEAILWCARTWGRTSGVPPTGAVVDETAGSDRDSHAGCSGIDGMSAFQTCEHRRWLWFIGFYTPRIREAFVEEANGCGLTGFLMPGKPAIAVLEGSRAVIDRFLVTTRTILFASVPPASRKMTVTLEEGAASEIDRSSQVPVPATSPIPTARLRRAFSDFREESLRCAPGSHVRGDISDIGALRALLDARGLEHIHLDDILQ